MKKFFYDISKKTLAAALGLLLVVPFFSACNPSGEDLMDVDASPHKQETPSVQQTEPTDSPGASPSATPAETAGGTDQPATQTNVSQLPVEGTASPYAGEKLVALTFDDGPYKNVTPRILDVVEQYADQGVHVTFFVLGLQVVQYPELVTRAHKLGCEIGNHTYHHAKLTKLTPEEMHKEVFDVVEMIEELTGKKPALVRPPYGAKDENVYQNVPFPLIMWDIDTLDWQTHDTASTVEAAIKAEDGDIILMHDVREDTAAAVEQIIPQLLNQGFKLVTVSEMFAAKGIPLEAGKQYRRAR